MVAGVDGCRAGWVVVRARLPARAGVSPGPQSLEGASLEAQVVQEVEPLVAAVRAGTMGAVAIDMPIGLLADQPRACDGEARQVLGHRHSTVFPAPVRPVLAARSYEEACQLSRAASGRALSRQAYHLVDRIRVLDELLDTDDGERFVEAHPECAFARLAGHPLDSKHSAGGRHQRLGLLRATLGPALDELVDGGRPASAPIIDLLDAAALVVTAAHVVAGTEIRLGQERDPTGKRAQIVY